MFSPRGFMVSRLIFVFNPLWVDFYEWSKSSVLFFCIGCLIFKTPFMYPFSIVYSWHLCHRLVDHICAGLFLGSLFYSFGLYVCFDGSTILFWWLKLGNVICSQDMWCLPLCPFSIFVWLFGSFVVIIFKNKSGDCFLYFCEICHWDFDKDDCKTLSYPQALEMRCIGAIWLNWIIPCWESIRTCTCSRLGVQK